LPNSSTGSSRNLEGFGVSHEVLLSQLLSGPGKARMMTAVRKAETPITIDVEASGFGRGSYPIEIGLAFPDQQVEALLILPAPDWTHWDPEAEAVHGISREQLQREGRPIVEVAALLNARLAGNRVFSDAWSFDTSWVGRLFDAAGFSQHFRIDTIRSLLTEEQVRVWQDARVQVEAEAGETRHRAAVDARLLQQTILRARKLTG